MDRLYRIIAICLALGAIGQVFEGFAGFVSRLDDILSPNVRLRNPTGGQLFRQGLLGIASTAPTLLVAAIFFHMTTLLRAISGNKEVEQSAN